MTYGPLSQLHLSDLVHHYPFIYSFYLFFFFSLSGEDVSMFGSIVNLHWLLANTLIYYLFVFSLSGEDVSVFVSIVD